MEMYHFVDSLLRSCFPRLLVALPRGCLFLYAMLRPVCFTLINRVSQSCLQTLEH